MRNLYIHCGLAKTGTTSIQKYLSAERKSLQALGVDYPEIGLHSTGIAQHQIANQIIARTEFNSETGAVGDILNYLRAPDRLPTVILSSEGFTNCLYNRRTRSRFLGVLRSAKELNDGVFLIFRVRPFSQYFDSWYVQRLKIGSASVDMRAYLHESWRWLKNFFQSLKALKETLGAESIIIIDANDARGDAVAALLERIGILHMVPNAPAERLNERLGLKKAAMIYQLQVLANADAGVPSSAVETLRDAILRLKDFPDDIFRYRVIPIVDANKIQTVASKCAPLFLMNSFADMLKPEPEAYEAVSLARTRISAADVEFLKSALPAEYQSSSLLDTWFRSNSAESPN